MRSPRLSATALGTLLLSLTITAQQPSRPAGWTEATHGASTAPNYASLFAMDRVHEIRITIPAATFAAMQEDLRAVSPPMPGGRGRFGGPGGGADGFAQMMEAGAAACNGKPAAAACTVDGTDGTCNSMFGGPVMCIPTAIAGMMQGGAINLTTRDPKWVSVTVEHEGRTWTKVGMRYKGNSSLVSAIGSGNGKIPFRLDFERNEDESPEIRNQRFHGFRELTFSSNFSDSSQLREVLASEIFRDRGIPAPRAAFYRVMIDSGNGPEYWGLYSMIEDPSDGAMLDAQFKSDQGNLYKPDGPGADWTRFDPAGFEKKTNEREADFTDVRSAIEALHAQAATPAAWRAGLEKVFDVDLFVRWLAVNTVIDNWDSYGVMSHNYYLYADPGQNDRLRWIPWDNNMAFGMGPGGFGGPGGPGGPGGARGFGGFGGRGGPPGAFPGRPGGPPPGARDGGAPAMPFPGFGAAADVLHRQVDARWPLIQKLMADDVYHARYRAELERAMTGLAAPAALQRRARELHTLIAPAVTGPRGERATHTTIDSAEAFAESVDGPNGLIAFMQRRQQTIRDALAGAVRP